MPTVAKRNEIAPGQMINVDLQGEPVAIANIDGAYYAFSDTCSHAGCSLAKGQLAGTTVTCPCHGSQFDVVSGHVLAGPATTRIRTYRVQAATDGLII